MDLVSKILPLKSVKFLVRNPLNLNCSVKIKLPVFLVVYLKIKAKVWLLLKTILYSVISHKTIRLKQLKHLHCSVFLETTSKLPLGFSVKQINFNQIKFQLNNKIIFLGTQNTIFFNHHDKASKKNWIILVIQLYKKYNLRHQIIRWIINLKPIKDKIGILITY